MEDAPEVESRISRVKEIILRHVRKREDPYTDLVVAMLAQAIFDAGAPIDKGSKTVREEAAIDKKDAIEFLNTPRVDHWASYLGIRGEWIREVARAHYRGPLCGS